MSFPGVIMVAVLLCGLAIMSLLLDDYSS